MGTDCSKGGEDFARGRERRDATPSQEADEVPLEISPEQHAALIANLKFAEIPIESFATVLHFQDAWDILRHFHTDPFKDHRWAFRGQANAAWKLEPSIERLKRAHSKRFRAGAEEHVRRAFKQRAHQYMQYLPAEKEELEWMALMRHHGAPTRFLDWTRSPYVAAFFAVAEAGEDVESAIWAIDTDEIRREAIRLLSRGGVIDEPEGSKFSFSEPNVFDRVFLRETSPAIVAPVRTLRTNERATSQQGLFLCPNSARWGFEFGLKQVLKSAREMEAASCRENNLEVLPPYQLFKLCIAPNAGTELLRELHRMNINYATLFPGLDGFARSRGTNITVSGHGNKIAGDRFDSRV
jgi:hypothetical protein